jgi:hypothetical protein
VAAMEQAVEPLLNQLNPAAIATTLLRAFSI